MVLLIILTAFGTQPGGTLTPRTLNSLSTITGHEGDEEDWERAMRDLQREEDEVSAAARFRQGPHRPPFFHLDDTYPASSSHPIP